MSDKSFLKRFDIFKKMPRDLTEPTNCGALGKYEYFLFLTIFWSFFLVSIICTFILVGLSMFEIQNYMKAESHAELIIDTSHRDDFVNINLDITFPRMPCDILSLDE